MIMMKVVLNKPLGFSIKYGIPDIHLRQGYKSALIDQEFEEKIQLKKKIKYEVNFENSRSGNFSRNLE